jgi:hypothetical protein
LTLIKPLRPCFGFNDVGPSAVVLGLAGKDTGVVSEADGDHGGLGLFLDIDERSWARGR